MACTAASAASAASAAWIVVKQLTGLDRAYLAGLNGDERDRLAAPIYKFYLVSLAVPLVTKGVEPNRFRTSSVPSRGV